MPQYVFNNLETPDPKMPFDFSYQGKPYRLRQNAVVDIPMEVAEHLNSLSVPVYADVHDPETGELVSRPVSTRQRFSVTPVIQNQKAAKAKEN